MIGLGFEALGLRLEQLHWLQRHDCEYRNICGMMPLCEGMLGYLTGHINRKRLLSKGRRGYMRTGTHATDGAETVGRITTWNQPSCPAALRRRTAHLHAPRGCVRIISRRQTQKIADWEPGASPIGPLRRTWHLDAKRKAPKLAYLM